MNWRTSTYSITNGDCIEISGGAMVGVRDSKLAESPVLTFGTAAWREFTASLKDGLR